MPLFYKNLKLVLLFNYITESLKDKVRSVGYNPVFSVWSQANNFISWGFLMFLYYVRHFEWESLECPSSLCSQTPGGSDAGKCMDVNR